MRVEGYLPENGEPGTIPLYLFWNGVETSQKDNLVTTNATVGWAGLALVSVISGGLNASM
jgi:hypothetical protein